MPLLRKQPFEKTKPPDNLKPDEEVFFCEATNEVFTDYELFFERTILCNSLVWSCSVTGKSGLTYEEAVDSEAKAKKRISNLPKPLKKGVLWLTHHKTKKGRLSDLVDDVYDWIKNRYFVDEIVDAVIGNQWCESTVLRVIPPTEDEIKADMEEVTEVEKDGSPKKEEGAKEGPTLEERLKHPPDHLYKYEVEETCPDDEDVVERHIIEADDVRRDKGILNRDKLSLYLKNVTELNESGLQFKMKSKGVKIYNLEIVAWNDIFAGPEPEFEESVRKVPMMTNKKKGQFTLDGWATKGEKGNEKKPAGKEEKEKKVKEVKKPKKQTPEEIEAEMKKLREAQAKYREEMRLKEEEAKKKRIEDKQKEKERKAEEKRLAKEIMQEWNSRREDLDCEDHKDLPKPTPIRCRIPNQLLGDFFSILEFLHSFSTILELKDTYPGGVTFAELESALMETETVDGAFYDILSFMLVSLFDLQLEEEEEAKAFTDTTANDELHEGLTGKDQDVAQALKLATETQFYTKKNLGLTLREVHLDQWSITEVLRLHLESSGAYRGNNLQNWRYNQRGGWRLTDDPGFQFCQENPQILASLHEKSVFELGVTEKLRILTAMMNQMLTFAGVRDELDNRIESINETNTDLKATRAEENKRLQEIDRERIKKKKEEKEKEKEQKLIEAENKDKKDAAAVAANLTTRQQEKAIVAKEREEMDKQIMKDKKREDFLERESELVSALAEYQRSVSVQCLGRDRAFRRFWVFDSVPGVFVEHDDDNIGTCREEPTPWNPDMAFTCMTEELASKKAREMLDAKNGDSVPSSPSSDKENKSKVNLSNGPNIPVGDVNKTYSKNKAPVMKQNVLGTNNGSLSVQKTEPVKVNGEVKEETETEDTKMEVVTEPPWGICLAPRSECPVHSDILPRTTWAYYSSSQELEQLLDSLNNRGVREGELRDKLVAERDFIENRLKKCKADQYVITDEDQEELGQKQLQEVQKRREKLSRNTGGDPLPLGTSLKEMIELSLRDQILELEEKIFFGNLGNLKVKSRDNWVAAITNKSYDMDTDTITWGEGEQLDSDSWDTETSRVKQLAAAIVQLGQMISEQDKYLKQPLGEDEKEKKKRLKKEEDARKKKEEAEAEDDEDNDVEVKVVMTPYKKWEKSLMSSTTFGQLFLHLTTLDNSIVWSKSIMNTKCKICRRKTDPDKMLLCDNCDNAYHMYCLKPKLKSIPEGDWFCPECKPKERVRSPRKKVRKSFSFNEVESDEEEDEKPAKKKAANNKSKKRVVESEEEEEEVQKTPPKKKAGGRRKIIESESEGEESEPSPVKNKKGGLANLLGKRGAAKKAENKIKGIDNSFREEDNEDDDEEQNDKRSRRSRGAKSKTEDKENTRKRGRNLNESIELNVTALEDVVKALIKHKDGWPFDRPITKAEVPDYHLHVKTPMDLGTVKSRLNDMFYTKNQQVIDDIRLVFSNCYSYNMEDAEEYGCAARLEKYFDNQLKSHGIATEDSSRKKRRY